MSAYNNFQTICGRLLQFYDAEDNFDNADDYLTDFSADFLQKFVISVRKL